MSVLLLIRHGQARYLEPNYDRLSPLGEEQARRLGDYWQRHGAAFDAVYCGPRERHARSSEIAGGVLRAAGRHWPEPVVLAEFDEYPAMEVLNAFLPVLRERHEHVHTLAGAFARADGGPERVQAADRLLREVSQRWVAGEVGSPEIESWDAFCARVGRGLDRVRRDAPKSTRVAVFTSGGPLAAAARLALGLTARATLDLTWSPRNTAWAEFLFSGDRFSLQSFNCHPHLEDPALWTYR